MIELPWLNIEKLLVGYVRQMFAKPKNGHQAYSVSHSPLKGWNINATNGNKIHSTVHHSCVKRRFSLSGRETRVDLQIKIFIASMGTSTKKKKDREKRNTANYQMADNEEL